MYDDIPNQDLLIRDDEQPLMTMELTAKDPTAE